MKELQFKHQTKEEANREFDAFINEINNPTKNKPQLMSEKHINPLAKDSYYKFSEMHNEYVYTLSEGGMKDHNYNFEENDDKKRRSFLSKYGNKKIHTVTR